MVKRNFLKYLFLGALLAGVYLLGTEASAWAQDDASTAAATLGDVICNSNEGGISLFLLFQYVAYAAGVFLVLQGIMHLKGNIDSPQNHPLRTGLMLVAGGSGLLTLPSIVSVIIASLFTQSTSNGTLACIEGDGGSGSAATGLDGMLSNFITDIQGPMVSLCSAIAVLAGLFMIIHGLMKASKYGLDPKANSVHSIVTNLVFGGLLMAIGDNLQIMMTSVFGTAGVPSINAASAGNSVLAWGFVSSLGGSQQFATAVGAALTFVQIIGVIAFIRGWMVMKKVVEGGSGNVTLAQGITHIVGGVLAINIIAFLKIMDTTFGTGLM